MHCFCASTAVAAQDRSTELDDQGIESRGGERQASAAGGLEREVEMARRRYEAAMKRWNDLK